jgi:hypothetical protein
MIRKSGKLRRVSLRPTHPARSRESATTGGAHCSDSIVKQPLHCRPCESRDPRVSVRAHRVAVSLALRDAVRRPLRNNAGLWIWVPAFAGTTGISSDTPPHSRGAMRPRLCKKRMHPSKREGAGNAGCALHPRSRVQNVQKKAHTSIQVQRRQSGIPCAMVLTVSRLQGERHVVEGLGGNVAN